MSLLFINKDYETIMANSMTRLNDSQLLKEVSRGDVARLLLAIFNEEFAKSDENKQDGFYDILKTEMLQAFLSSAKEDALDAIGNMLYCNRTIEELDEAYRYRISKQILNLATANETAVRLACLSVAGVDDVVMKAYTHGTGSGSIYVINKDPEALDDLIPLVQDSARKAGGWGTRIEVFKPRFLEVKVRVRLVFYKEVSELDQTLIRDEVKNRIEDYLSSRNCGENLDVAYIKEIAAKTSNQISEEAIYYMAINGLEILPIEQTCSWNERFVPAQTADAIIIS